MQVKKFEARTMKEALEMVKTQLGPDAIILSARDNQQRFGLVGEGSVEITAAVSDETLQKKKFAESRMRPEHREQFNKSPARQQKDVIDKMVTKYNEKTNPKPITGRRYADIDDDQAAHDDYDNHQFHDLTKVRERVQLQGRKDNVRQLPTRDNSRQNDIAREIARQQGNAAVARQVAQVAPAAPAPVKAPSPVALAPALPKREEKEMENLRGEIASLREIIARFQTMPQTMVGTHPGADYGIPFDLSFMFERLTSTGVAPELVGEMLTKAQDVIPALKLKNRNLVDGWVARHILETTMVTDGGHQGKLHVFVGTAGAGKTNAMVKMASHLVVKEKKKVALLTADTFKVGAADQMRIYAQILNVPFAIVRSMSDWAGLMRYMTTVDVVLVDMPGMSLKNQEEIEHLRNLMPPAALNPRVHFVGSAVAKDGDLTEAGKRYSVIGIDDAIFTSLDESTQHGTIYNFVRRFGVPLHAFGIGRRVPEDYELATRERVLDLLFRITSNNSSNQSQADI